MNHEFKLALDREICILRLPDAVTRENGRAEAMAAIFEELLASDLRNVVLDFTECVETDATFVGEIVGGLGRFTRVGGALQLNRPSERFKKLMKLAKLEPLFAFAEADYQSKIWLDASEETFRRIRTARDGPAELSSLLLTIDSGRIRVEPGASAGIYKISVGKDPGDHLLVVSAHVAAAVTRTCFRTEIEALETILNSPDATESDLQAFFEEHPAFLTNQTYDRAHPHVILQRGDLGPLIPDFLLQPFNDIFCDVLELKHPAAPVIVGRPNRRRFSGAVMDAAAQLQKYRAYFDDAGSREIIRRRYGITAYRPKLAVVVGRRTELDPVELRLVGETTPNVKVMTYDELLERAKRFVLS